MTNKLFYILLLILNCVISAVSQVLLKKSARKEYTSFWKQYFNLPVIIAYIIYIIVLVLNIYVMKYISMLAVAPISGTLPFILSIFFGRIFFHEKITARKVVGSLLIIAGIVTIVLVQG